MSRSIVRTLTSKRSANRRPLRPDDPAAGAQLPVGPGLNPQGKDNLSLVVDKGYVTIGEQFHNQPVAVAELHVYNAVEVVLFNGGQSFVTQMLA